MPEQEIALLLGRRSDTMILSPVAACAAGGYAVPEHRAV